MKEPKELWTTEMKERQKATIYDIAQLAGNSASTVSYALNGTWKKRRIKPETVEKIKKIAKENGYRVNLQARNLRNATSGLLGMILPEHDTRFFAELSQAFAQEVRNRESCPAIVLSGRASKAQEESIRSLISYNVDAIVIAAATDPNPLAKICAEAGVPHVFVDHASDQAPSVVTDNAFGAKKLTESILERTRIAGTSGFQDVYFLGGDIGLPSTQDRISGFCEAHDGRLDRPAEDRIIACGYAAEPTTQALKKLHEQLGRLPAALFVNSIICFEGVVRHLATLEEQEISKCVLGCFDYDPFVPLMRFPVLMVRQRADLMIEVAFSKLDDGVGSPSLSMVPPDLLV